MEINESKCVGCGNCHAVCPMGAISLNADGISVVDQVECYTCHRVLRDEGYAASFVGAVKITVLEMADVNGTIRRIKEAVDVG